MSYWLKKNTEEVEASPKLWLIDLDDTLINSNKALFPILHERMTSFIENRLGLPHDEALSLRSAYWRRYGSTFLGLMKHHGVDPDEFLMEAHDFDVYAAVEPDNELRRTLERLPGRKVLYTNAPDSYAFAAIRRLRLHGVFCRVVTSSSAKGFGGERLPKPNGRMMKLICAANRVSPRDVVFVDDSLHNLSIAAKEGFRCVWFVGHRRNSIPTPSYVEARISSIKDLNGLVFKRRNKKMVKIGNFGSPYADGVVR